MDKPKEIKSKVDTIRAFLEEHQPKLPEARGFLQFLMAKEEILRRIEIVTDLDALSESDCAILISAKGAGSWPFLYRREQRFLYKTSQAVVELMKSVPDRIFLCLSTIPPEWSEERQQFLEMLAEWHEEVFRDDLERITRRQTLLQLIDQALESGDRGTFQQLSAELRQLG